MKTYLVEFTQEVTQTLGFYVKANNREDAFDKGQAKYYECKKPDHLIEHYSETLGDNVEEA